MISRNREGVEPSGRPQFRRGKEALASVRKGEVFCIPNCGRSIPHSISCLMYISEQRWHTRRFSLRGVDIVRHFVPPVCGVGVHFHLCETHLQVQRNEMAAGIQISHCFAQTLPEAGVQVHANGGLG